MARAGKLRLFETTVNKPFSGSDDRLIPAASLSVAVHRQGATAAETKSIAITDTTLAVRDPGALRVGETIQLGTDATETMTVTSIDSRTQVTIKSTTGSPVSVSSGDRLVPQTKPTIYAEPTGAASTSNPLTTDSLGYASCYVYEQAVDYILSGSGYTTLLVEDHRTGAVDSVFNVLDYGAVGDGATDDEPALNRLFDQVALLAPDEGIATIYFPRGVYYLKTPLVPDGENVTGAVSNIAIKGEKGAVLKAATTAAGGTWTATSRTALLSFKNNTNANENWTISGLELDGASVGAVGGATTLAGIVTAEITNLLIEDCFIHDFGDPLIGTGSSLRNDGIILGDDISDTTSAPVQDATIRRCRFERCVRNAITCSDVSNSRIVDCYINDCDNFGIAIAPDFVFQATRDITIDNVSIDTIGVTAISAIPAVSLQGVLYNDQFEGLRIRNCFIDGNDDATTGIAIGNWKNVSIIGGDIHHVQLNGIHVRSSQLVNVADVTIADITTTATGAGIYIESDLTVGTKFITLADNMITTMHGFGIYLEDVDTGTVVGNVIDDVDNGNNARDGIRVTRDAGTAQRVSLVGNTCTNSLNGSGINIASSSVASCTISRNICLGNGATDQITDAGTDTHWGQNVTGSYASHTTTAYMSCPNVGAPPGGGASAWGGEFTCNSAAVFTVVTAGCVKGTNALVLCTPSSSLAAANASAFFVSSTANGQFRVGHATGIAGLTYHYIVLNTD